MKQTTYFWWGLVLFAMIVLGLWLGFLQGLAGWLWQIVHGIPPVANAH